MSALWKTITIKNWSDFEDAISNLKYREWLFRGHSNSKWKLESSYYRLFNQIKKNFSNAGTPTEIGKHRRRYEERIIGTFKAQAHLYLNNFPTTSNKLEWLTIMQHYGTPTRLLDMTFSPYVALYFAIEHATEQACVFAIKPGHFDLIYKILLGSKYREKIFDEKKNDDAFFIGYEPKIKNERVVAQQGAFLVSSTNYQTYDEIFSYTETPESACLKFIIEPQFYLNALEKLIKMNITSASLFPGLEGFCKSLRFKLLEEFKEAF